MNKQQQQQRDNNIVEIADADEFLRHCTERSFAVGYRQRTGHKRRLGRVNVVAVVVAVVVAATAVVVVAVRMRKGRWCDLAAAAAGPAGRLPAQFGDGVQSGDRMLPAGGDHVGIFDGFGKCRKV